MIAAARGKAVPVWAVLLSVALQVPLAVFLGHLYDTRIFMATGYLVRAGFNPYIPRDLSAIFQSPLFHGLTSIGYPPPWALLLGLAYRASYEVCRSLFLYNLAIKVPVIAANVGLAFVAQKIAGRLGAPVTAQRGAAFFMLFNPLLLYTTAAWGQFDSVVALCAFVGVYLLYRERLLLAAALLALAVSLKPTALPLMLLALFFAQAHRDGRPVRLTLGMLAALAAFCVAPFAVFGWDPGIILRNWSAHSSVAGGLSWLTFFELLFGTTTIPAGVRLLGFLWVPALAAGAVLLRPRRNEGLPELLQRSLRLLLVFFLARAWLSEPNVDLLLPFAVVLCAAGRLEKRRLHALWLIPLVFTVFNASVTQLLFLVWPDAMALFSALDEKAWTFRLLARCAAVVPWLVLGWRIAFDGRLPAGSSTDAGTIPRHAPEAGDPLLNVILPTFNEAENIVVDHGSPDGTAARATGEKQDVSRGDASLRRASPEPETGAGTVSGVGEVTPAVRFEGANGITLRIASHEHDVEGYPSSRIRKGLTMSCGAVDLSEEGVGFGVPVIKQPRETIFPGTMKITAASGASVAVAEYDMDLVERLSLRTRRSLVSAALNAVREPLALLHRRYPFLRSVLIGISNVMRAAFGIRTTFEHGESLGTIRVTYRFDAAAGKVRVHVEAPDLPAEMCTELIIMNEQGAHFFDRYTDSTGCARQGAAIETWQEVSARDASFLDLLHGVFFSMKSAPGARLFRGRELVEGRLAWAGLAYVLPPDTKEFWYDISMGAPG